MLFTDLTLLCLIAVVLLHNPCLIISWLTVLLAAAAIADLTQSSDCGGFW